MVIEGAAVDLLLELSKLTGLLLGGGALGAIIVKRMNKAVDQADVERIKAEAKEAAANVAQAELQIMRDILTEVRNNDSHKSELLGRYEADLSNLTSRVQHLEERERHMLVRAAVHEAWDQMAFQAIIQHRPDFAPPPPLSLDAKDRHE